MTFAGQVGFVLVVLSGILTIVALGHPRRYRDRGVGWVLISLTWSTLLFDAMLGVALFRLVTGPTAEWLFLLFLYLRVPAQAALFWIVVKSRRRL